MSVDASAVARTTGIGTAFKNLRAGGVLNCPQRIAVFAQGSTGVTYPSTKQQVTSGQQTGNIYGFGSPAHLVADQLFPTNGDGVGTIPVTIYPLQDDGSGTAAQGTITPSGTMLLAGSFRVRVSGILSNAFVLPVGALNVSSACGLIGGAISAVLGMPVNGGYTYGAVTASALVGTGNGTLTALSVTGTPLPGAWTLKVNTAVANGGVWTLTDPNGSVISVALTQTVGAGAATVFAVGGLQFTVTDGATDFGLGATFTITVPATNVKATAKWKGSSGNDLLIEVLGDATLGAVFTVSQPSGGLVNPSIAAALAQMGNIWETMIINAMELADTTTLTAFNTFGEGRWGDLVHAPLMVFTGENGIPTTSITAVSDSRKTDRINVAIPGVGSPNLSFIICARAVSRMAPLANNNPPTDYGTQPLSGIIPGNDGDQWDYPTRDLAVKAGSSTIEVSDGVVQLSDVVTFYHPTGDPTPAYRYAVDIVKLQNVIYNLNLIFSAPEWAAAPLIPDGQATVNPNARSPKSARTEIAALVDDLGLQAIISDPATAKKTITANINAQNPKRLDVGLTVQLAGNSDIKSVTLNFGFFFGG